MWRQVYGQSMVIEVRVIVGSELINRTERMFPEGRAYRVQCAGTDLARFEILALNQHSMAFDNDVRRFFVGVLRNENGIKSGSR